MYLHVHLKVGIGLEGGKRFGKGGGRGGGEEKILILSYRFTRTIERQH